MSKPEFVKVDDKLYKLNTDFRVALRCNEIAIDDTIDDYERALAIIYLLFGEQGLECKNISRLIELAMIYISLGEEQKGLENEPRDDFELDYLKCEGLIRSSFKFDYKYDPYEMEYLHWYDFYNDLANLSTSEFGNCCVFNRVVGILYTDVSKIKDSKERKKIIDAQKELKKKYCVEKKKQLSQKEKESVNELYKALRFKVERKQNGWMDYNRNKIRYKKI